MQAEIDQALALHQQGKLAEAERIYSEILRQQANHFDALHLLGVIAVQTRRTERGIELITRAIGLNEMVAAAHNSLGIALRDLKRSEEALASYDKAIALKPDYAEAHNNRGNALRDLKRSAEALASYDKALALKPGYAEAHNNRGIALRDLKRSEEALVNYDKAIALKPDYAEAYTNRGNALRDLKRSEEALASYDKALALKPDYAEAHNNRGNALRNLKRSEEALVSYDKALSMRPDYAEVCSNRGNALQDLKRSEEALASYDKAIALKPYYAEAYSNRGIALQDLKRFDEALASCDKAIALKPDYAEAHNNRGNALRELKRSEEALASYDKALSIRPDYAEVYSNRGNALQDLKRSEEAPASYDKAIALKPDYAEAHNNRGNALRELKRSEEALASYDKAIALKPDYAKAYNNRGNALRDLKEEALASYDKALAIRPDYAEVCSNRGNALQDLKRPEEALASYERALAATVDDPYAFSGAADCVMKLCDWDKRTRIAADVNAHVSSKKLIVYPFVLLGYSGDPELQLQCARDSIEHRFPSLPPPFWSGQTWQHDKLRVTYLSADFRSHPVAYLTAELFEQHDRSRFEIIGVSFSVNDRGEMRKRLVAAFDEFHDVRRTSDKEVAKLLYDRQVDIAVDLMGYTLDSRPGIFAHRPAPIQVSYLGFPATMGTQFINYIIADKVVAPFEHQQFYTEKIVHLPDCFQVNDSKRKITENTPTWQNMGLPEQAFVFCCFNAVWKITPAIFDIWMQLLHQVEGSVLWLIWDNESAERNLRKEAQRRGIDPSRLVFAGRLPFDKYLARDCLADMFLDTLPYNAGTTASDALWVGLPVLTCKGEAFAGRMAASLLHAVGVPELITCNLEEYKALALKLARNPALLAEIKAKLVRNRNTCPLFNTGRFARHIEAAYRMMWETWQRGEVPKSFKVEPIDLVRSVGVARA